MEVTLESRHGFHTYASVAFGDISATWQQYIATLTANATDTTAHLAVKLQVASLTCANLYMKLCRPLLVP